MLTGSEQNWRSFTRSVLSMMTEILLKRAIGQISGVSVVPLGLPVVVLQVLAANTSLRGLFTVVNLSSRRRQPAGLAWGIFTG